MENQLQVFNSDEFGKVRVVMRDGEPWFVAADVCRVLEIRNISDALSRIDADEKGIANTDTPGGEQQMLVINESGLYALTLTSRKPKAKEFRKWLTGEVAVSIRKTGSYSVKPVVDTAHSQIVTLKTAINDIGDVAESLRNVFGVAQGMALAKATTIVETTYQIDLTEVKTLIAPVEDAGTLTATAIAKLVGMKSGQAVNNALCDLGLAERTDNGLILTDEGKKYAEQIPFAATNGHCGYQIKWNRNVLPFLQ